MNVITLNIKFTTEEGNTRTWSLPNPRLWAGVEFPTGPDGVLEPGDANEATLLADLHSVIVDIVGENNIANHCFNPRLVNVTEVYYNIERELPFSNATGTWANWLEADKPAEKA